MPPQPFDITSLVNMKVAAAIVLMAPDTSTEFIATTNAVAAVAAALTALVALGRDMGLWRSLRTLLRAWIRELRRWWRRWRGFRR